MRVSVVGSEEFALGFKLAGINASYEMEEGEVEDRIEDIAEEEEGVVIIEGSHMDALPKRRRMELQDSVDPVVIPVEEEAESEDLRNKIKQAIGVDLWAE
ncbi:MAG: V-type ATP synthase subunit F [Candidatus Nanohaloarchaeota archaeon QJJ-7]|nr:V-type ATP synthase subunit F [Candidatus Nanohaloarchaeota archaeon QJJ-7]